jgi:hypothetical protein
VGACGSFLNYCLTPAVLSSIDSVCKKGRKEKKSKQNIKQYRIGFTLIISLPLTANSLLAL